MFDAVDYVEQLSKDATDRGSVPERVAAAIEVAAFLLGLDEDGEEVDEDEDAPVISAPATRVSCTVSPGDYVEVFAEPNDYDTPRVRLRVVEGVRPSSVALTPADARSLAAGLLNAADEADGTTPLTFTTPPTA
ncbi:hypothetical protein ACPXB5_11230 [Micromonospora arida]|uniref:hypothetical protein n=1 Tax=Micromonospora arida TaxID=2203715 RepID=UPI003CE951BD